MIYLWVGDSDVAGPWVDGTSEGNLEFGCWCSPQSFWPGGPESPHLHPSSLGCLNQQEAKTHPDGGARVPFWVAHQFSSTWAAEPPGLSSLEALLVHGFQVRFSTKEMFIICPPGSPQPALRPLGSGDITVASASGGQGLPRTGGLPDSTWGQVGRALLPLRTVVSPR